MKDPHSRLAVAALVALAGGQAFAKPAPAKPATAHRRDARPRAATGSRSPASSRPRPRSSGRCKVANYDEAALKVAGAGAVKKIPVGKKILLGRGHYVITMVGQASDDNHLKLTVS